MVRDWPFTRGLAWRMFLRDTRATYRQSFLGYFWLLLPALANTLVWVFLNGAKVVNIDSGDVPYPLFVFTGTVLWIDPELDLFFIFLSNLVHPNGKGLVNPLAGQIATVVASAIRDKL